MKTCILYGALAVRVAVSWWLLLVLATVVVDGQFAILGALLLYPPLTLMLGGIASWLHHHGLSKMAGGVSPLAVVQRQSISLPLPADDALRLAQGSIRAAFGQSDQRVTEGSITACVIEHGTRPTPSGAWHSNELTVVAATDGPGRSLLHVTVKPSLSWLYRFFWVDAGRCARQLEQLRHALLARVRAQGDAASASARQTELKSRLANAELLLLRAQIEPHFLFNTLAHIHASIHAHAPTAESMLEALIAFLRSNSRTLSSASISLHFELQRVQAYLGIMQMRLGERLSFSIECAESLRARSVPTACVLILVENAIKHGIERRDAAGRIAVTCREAHGVLEIDVDNDGPGLERSLGVGGEGLDNLRQRLRLTYGDAARILVEDRDEGGVRASLRLPLVECGHDD